MANLEERLLKAQEESKKQVTGTFDEQLEMMQVKGREMKPEEDNVVFDVETKRLVDSKIEENTIKVGDKLPNFDLVDAQGNQYTNETFKGKKLVFNFFRGSWCPFCNMELGFLEAIQDEIEGLNGKLISVSPEKFSAEKKEESKDAESIITSDSDNNFAKELGLVYELNEAFAGVYGNYGLDIKAVNQSDKAELPMPATIITDENGVVIYVFAKADYVERINPDEILNVLKK